MYQSNRIAAMFRGSFWAFTVGWPEFGNAISITWFLWQAKAGSFHRRDAAADLLTVVVAVAMAMINGYPKKERWFVRMFLNWRNTVSQSWSSDEKRYLKKRKINLISIIVLLIEYQKSSKFQFSSTKIENKFNLGNQSQRIIFLATNTTSWLMVHVLNIKMTFVP